MVDEVILLQQSKDAANYFRTLDTAAQHVPEMN